MKFLRNILSISLALSLAAAGAPGLFRTDSASHEAGALKSVLQGVEGLSKSADNPQDFEENIIKAINAFNAAAGLEKTYKNNSNGAACTPGALDQPYLPVDCQPASGLQILFAFNDAGVEYQSRAPAPAERPPQLT